MERPWRIGIVGYSQDKFDHAKATRILQEALDLRAITHPESEVVSGYTDMGVPGIAYRVAQQVGMSTVGIACEKASEHPCFPCDKVIIEGDEWGDESPTFLKYIDEMVKVGGGKQSIAEYEKFDGPKEEFELEWYGD